MAIDPRRPRAEPARNTAGWAVTRRTLARLCGPVVTAGRRDGFDGLCVSRSLEQRLAGVLYASDPVARRLDDLQQVIGEGPGVTALSQRSPVFVPRLDEDVSVGRWEAFRQEAEVLDVASLFCFPVQMGAVGLGLMTVHGRRPVRLEDGTLSAYIRLSDALAVAFIAPDEGAPAVDEPDPGPLSNGPTTPWGAGGGDLLDAGSLVTHQAVGHGECPARVHTGGSHGGAAFSRHAERRHRQRGGPGTWVASIDFRGGPDIGRSGYRRAKMRGRQEGRQRWMTSSPRSSSRDWSRWQTPLCLGVRRGGPRRSTWSTAAWSSSRSPRPASSSTTSGGNLRVLASSSEEMRVLELLELQNGEGPCFEAFTTGEPVTVTHLADRAAQWPVFAPAATAQGVLAVYALPMRLAGPHGRRPEPVLPSPPPSSPRRSSKVAHAMTSMPTLGHPQPLDGATPGARSPSSCRRRSTAG